MPILITKDNKVYGSVIYEDVGTDDMILEFYTSKFDPENILNCESSTRSSLLPRNGSSTTHFLPTSISHLKIDKSA